MGVGEVTFLGREIVYVNGDLHVEGVDLRMLSADPQVGTPVYVYSLALMKRRYAEFEAAVRPIDPSALVCFAVKSLSNQSVLSKFAEWGAGADLVTRGELERALRAGFDPAKIVFSGLGKSEDDLKRAISQGVQINFESLSELKLAQACAKELGRPARAALRLNPQLDAMRGHLGQITTGKPDSKFGIPWTKIAELLPHFRAEFPDIELVGASVHIGSNLDVEGGEADSFAKTFEFLATRVVRGLIDAGAKTPVCIDLGGGIGVDYNQTPTTGRDATFSPNRWLAPYAALVRNAFGLLVDSGQVRLVFEPGRFLSGEAGVLLTKVLHVKDETERKGTGEAEHPPFSVRFLIVDAGMNDLMRPALYGAYHHIVPVRYAKADANNVDICGAACETTDSFMRPTKEWLERYNNLFMDRADASASEMDSKERTQNPRRLRAEATGFGESAPKAHLSEGRVTYEYFVKRRFPSTTKGGDLLAILNAGAYGAVMASEYNSRPLVPEVLVDGNRYAVIRPRPSYDELIGRDCAPEWKEG